MRFSGRKEFRFLNCENAKITETLYHRVEYTRDMVMQEVARLQRKYPNKEFRVLLPYDRPMSSSPFGSSDPIHLFTMADIYNESQFPDPEKRPLDPETYDRFWVYINKPIVLAGGC